MARVAERLKPRLTRLWMESEAGYQEAILREAGAIDGVETMLDVGCDDGGWTLRVAGAVPGAPRVLGIEAVAESAKIATAAGIDVRVGDLEERWPIDDATCDLVHANQVIEHVKRLDHFVAEIFRVLRPGGQAIICTENLSSWHNVAAVAVGWMPFSSSNISTKGPIGNPLALHNGEAEELPESWQHIHVITLGALRAMFELHGFEVESQFGSGYYPLWGKAGRAAARRDPRHAHFIGVRARKPRPA
jgi:SAM-dependent methyltransferase